MWSCRGLFKAVQIACMYIRQNATEEFVSAPLPGKTHDARVYKESGG
jgi:hypothetical protein